MSSQSPISERKPLSQRFVGPRGHSLLPGGFGKSLTAVDPWSPMAVCGRGSSPWDDAGRELIDLHANFTVNVHGNSHPTIVEAATAAVTNGMSFGLANRYEV